MQRLLVPLLVPLLLLTAGCAVVGVKVDNASPGSLRRDAIAAARANDGSPAAAALIRAQEHNLAEADRAATLLEAARLSSAAGPVSPDHAINIEAARGLLALMSARAYAPLELPGGRILGTSADSRRTLDPRTADSIVPAGDLEITRLRVRTVQEGAGLPCVAHFPPRSITLQGQPGIPPLAGICEPVTLVIEPSGRNPRLVFYRTCNTDTAVVAGRRTRLAADFSAPLAYLLSRGQNRSLDIRAMLRTDRNFRFTGLYQFSRFDPEKIPVVLVHGLMSRPETWVPAINELMAEREIRERYQFWLFLYPTGLPVWASAAMLRSELDRYRKTLDPERENRAIGRTVLVGHSMGGLISSLQIRTGGKALWRQFMHTPPEELSLSPALKERVVKIVQFQARPEVSRVVFFATPHRGSELAVNPFSEFFARLIRLPFTFADSDLRALRAALREEFRELFVAPANSLVFLRANSPLLKSILALPMRPGVPYHSVIGDRGLGNTPDSSDGVVPYWSSRLKGAQSEKIVPSGHGAHEHPEGIAELARILKAHR